MRLMPQNTEAEMSLVGSAMINPAEVVAMCEARGVGAESFYNPKCRAIWSAIRDDVARRGTSDLTMVVDRMQAEGTLESVGGYASLHEYIDATPTAAHAAHYMDIVAGKALARNVIVEAEKIAQQAATAEDGQRLVSDCVTALMSLCNGMDGTETAPQAIDRILEEWRVRPDQRTAGALSMPWPMVNQITGGLESGIFILAGRPSCGKTTLECMQCGYLSDQGIPVGRITLDSTRDELLKRAISRQSNIPLPVLRNRHATDEQMRKAAQAAKRVAEWPQYIADKLRDISSITAQIRAWRTRYKIRLATVDFIQLIQTGERDPNRRVSEVSCALKLLSLELDIPILVLSQLSRATDKEGRTPRLSDLRDSGSLEQDAHKVAFIYPDTEWIEQKEAIAPGSTRRQRRAFLDVLKNKDGELGKIPLTHYPARFWFEEERQLCGADEDGGSI